MVERAAVPLTHTEHSADSHTLTPRQLKGLRVEAHCVGNTNKETERKQRQVTFHFRNECALRSEGKCESPGNICAQRNVTLSLTISRAAALLLYPPLK